MAVGTVLATGGAVAWLWQAAVILAVLAGVSAVAVTGTYLALHRWAMPRLVWRAPAPLEWTARPAVAAPARARPAVTRRVIRGEIERG